MKNKVMKIYDCLLEHFGAQGWWPGESRFEIIVGAILTQAVTWKNVEKAIAALRSADLFSEEGILASTPEELAFTIRPALYHRQKARKLAVMMEFVLDQYAGDYDRMFAESLENLRSKLLALWGIGPETADSILLYAGNYPVFVVDTYTRRVFSRLGLVGEDIDYTGMQKFLHQHTPVDVRIYNEYHALLVALGAQYCKKTVPHCRCCPLALYCGQ